MNNLTVFDIIAIIDIVLAFSTFIIGVIFIRPRYDKLFKNIYDSYDPQIPFFKFVTRTMNYMFAIIIRDIKKRKTDIGELYGYYNFRSHANLFEIILSYVFVYSTLTAIALGLILVFELKILPFLISVF